MSSVFLPSSKPSSPSHSNYSSTPSSPLHHTFSVSMMEENLEYAEQIIKKWDDLHSSSFTKVTSLFSADNGRESKAFVKAVKDLKSAMHFFVKQNHSSERLIHCQNLMQIAMKRLEKEFYQILSANRNSLDPEKSVSSRSSAVSKTSTIVSDYECGDSDDGNEFQFSINSISEAENVTDRVTLDLNTIADCMISSGYGQECVKIYKLVRKSIIDETMYNLGVDKVSISQIQKMNWEALQLKIKNWLNAVKVAIQSLFLGERILCDMIFSASDAVRESCFVELCKERALTLFGFPEVVAKTKMSPEKMFKILDLYETISELWPDIESIFSSESLSSVRNQAMTSLSKLRDAVRTMLSDFETAIQKDTSKSVVHGGGVHPLTRYVMNYVVFISDYSGSLSDIVSDFPLTVQTPLPESYFSSPIPGEIPTTGISVRLTWIILVMLCKLDGKAKLYKDVALSYLFLANNLNYVVSKIRTSNLVLLLSPDWLAKHEAKVKQYAGTYERMGWSKVMTSLPEDPTADISFEEAKECFFKFNSGFEEAYQKQNSWVITDPKLRDEVKLYLAKKITPAYGVFYEKYRGWFRRGLGEESVVRFAPEDLDNYLSDLFYGNGDGSGSVTSHSGAPPSSSYGKSERRGH